MASLSVVLNTNDIEKAVSFYQGLGFKTTYKGEDDQGTLTYVDLELEGAELGLAAIQASDDPEFRDWVQNPLGAGVLVTITVSDVDGVFEKARDMGAVIEHEPEDRSYGRVFTLNDPDGYVVSFITG